jgi:hypothetical protein
MASAALSTPPTWRGSPLHNTNHTAADANVREYVIQEILAIETRVDRLLPFSSTMTMVPAAGVPTKALALIETQQRSARKRLREAGRQFLRWLESTEGKNADAAKIQGRLVVLKLRFNAVLAQFDIFADVLVQRSESGTGVWIAGLDDLAADSLRLAGSFYETPELICYLDRGHGAAIRRARTELPGGDENPVAIIKIPRERMVGLGIGASLVHEVGHQAAAILNLVPPLIASLRKESLSWQGMERNVWNYWERWMSEIVADMWSLGQLGITATYGLMGVVSLPRFFMFQIDSEGPHPFPWIRVMISIELGRALYPDAQWDRVEAMWRSMYPANGLDGRVSEVIASLNKTRARCAAILLQHRPSLLNGLTVGECFQRQGHSPELLRSIWRKCQNQRAKWSDLRPTLALAAIGQARVDGKTSPADEARTISALLRHWAIKSSLSRSQPLMSF